MSRVRTRTVPAHELRLLMSAEEFYFLHPPRRCPQCRELVNPVTGTQDGKDVVAFYCGPCASVLAVVQPRARISA